MVKTRCEIRQELQKKKGDDIPSRRPTVRAGKLLDPVHHGPLREARAIALRNEGSENVRIRYLAHASGKSTLKANSSRERYPVVRPSATVSQEVSGLHLTRGFSRARNVVRATYDAVTGRDSIVGAE